MTLILRLRRASMAIGLILFIGASAASAAAISWNRADNIKDAADRLAGILKTRGASGAYKFISACYGTHTLSEKYTQGLEACIAQDYMLTEVMAAIYTRMPAAKRKEIGVVEPEELARTFAQRVGSTLAHYKMTEADGLTLKKLVEEHGLPIFAKATLPPAAQ